MQTLQCGFKKDGEPLVNDFCNIQPTMAEQQTRSLSLDVVEEHVPRDIRVRVEEEADSESPISMRIPLVPSSAPNGGTSTQLLHSWSDTGVNIFVNVIHSGLIAPTSCEWVYLS